MIVNTIGYIGGGRIVRVFLTAFETAGNTADTGSVVVYEPDTSVADGLKSRFDSITIVDSVAEACRQDIVVLAIHPPVLRDLLPVIKGSISGKATVMSPAPKVTIETIATALNTPRIVRMIPNATSLVGKGYNPVAFHPDFDDGERWELRGFFSPLGTIFETQESKLEGYALLSAMLPTYFWFQIKELVELGTPFGLSRDEAADAVRTTLDATVSMYFDSGVPYEQLVDLIPGKPIRDHEEQIAEMYRANLSELYKKLKP